MLKYFSGFVWVVKPSFSLCLPVILVPGRSKKLREACRKLLHRFSTKSDHVVRSYVHFCNFSYFLDLKIWILDSKHWFSNESDSKNSFSRSRSIGSDPGIMNKMSRDLAKRCFSFCFLFFVFFSFVLFSVVLGVVLVVLGVICLVPVAVARCATFTCSKTTPRSTKTTPRTTQTKKNKTKNKTEK